MKSSASEGPYSINNKKKIELQHIQNCISLAWFCLTNSIKIKWWKKIMLYVKNNIILLKIMNEVNLEGNTFKTKKY